MKKKLVMLICLFLCLNGIQAQNDQEMTVMKTRNDTVNGIQAQNDQEMTVMKIRNDTVISISELQQSSPLTICTNEYTCVVVYAEGCDNVCWTVNGATYTDNPMTFDSQVSYVFGGYYTGCGIGFGYGIVFKDPNVPNDTYEELWIHGGELAELQAVEPDSASMYDIRWNTGENENIIYKPAGTYIAGISDMCATAYRTKIVRETPELTASCDLSTGYNMLEWETNAEQATYVVSLNIYYDYDPNCLYSELVANVDYNAGSYTDTNHDSWQSPCQYHAVPVMANGEEAPFRTYWVRTISLFDLMGTQGLQQLQWTPYVTEKDSAKNTSSVLAYKIFDVVDGQPSYRATVGSFATSYNYDPSQFNGHAAVAAQLNNGAKDELLAYSRTQYKIGDPDGTQENQKPTFAVYPNPTTGVINIQVEGNDHNITIYNMVGQTIYTGVAVNGVFTTPRLTPGLYTVVCDGGTQKVVVE